MAGTGGNVRRRNGSARTALRRRVAAMGLPCAICGRPIDYTLPPNDPMAYELDEIVPVSRGGSPLDFDNVQPSHRACNQRKGNRLLPRGATLAPSPAAALCETSQDWSR